MSNLANLKKNIPNSLQQEIDKAMNQINDWFQTSTWPDHFEDLKLSPAIDLVDDKDNFKVEVEMPGMGEEDVKVSIHDGYLNIRGEKSTSKQDKGKNYIIREISYGNYDRSIALPDSVDVDQAKASFKKGMLWVTIPKKNQRVQKSREIPVIKA